MEPKQIIFERKLSIGIYVMSILFVVLGSLWVIGFLFRPSGESAKYLFWGIPYIIGGMGMLRKKYWALRFTQAYLIFVVFTGVVLLPFTVKELGVKNIDSFGVLAASIVIFIFFVFPLWFLFKKSTIAQFRQEKIVLEGRVEGDKQGEGLEKPVDSTNPAGEMVIGTKKKRFFGNVLGIIGGTIWGVSGIIAFFSELTVVIQHWGFLGACLGFVLFPVTFTVVPFYVFIVNRDWHLLFLVYGCGVISWALMGVGAVMKSESTC